MADAHDPSPGLPGAPRRTGTDRGGVGHTSPDALVKYQESRGEVTVILRRPTTRYLDALLHLRCGPHLLTLGVFPSAKEITESFAAVEAAVRRTGVDVHDPTVAVVCVGDGTTPRTAATFALRTAWTCHSVDPALGPPDRFADVRRLHVHPIRAQSFHLDWQGPVIVVAVHAHVRVATVVASLRADGCDVAAAVVLPCCGFESTDPPADMTLVDSHVDWGIWSPYRTVDVWLPHR